MINKIRFLLVILVVALCAFTIPSIKNVKAATNKLNAGKEINISGLSGNLNNINIKIEFTTSVNLDGNNNALLIGLVSSDYTLLTDARFVVSPTNAGVYDENNIALVFQNAPQTIGTKANNGSSYTYKIETKDFNIVNGSKDISKLVIVGQKGIEIDSEISFTEVKYAVKFGNSNAVYYSYNELISAPSKSYTYDITGHQEANAWTGDDSSTFAEGTTRATKDINYTASYGSKVNHNWTDVQGVSATREVNGVKAHQVCSQCGAMRIDSNSTSCSKESDLTIIHTCSYSATFNWNNAKNPGDKPSIVYTCGCGYSHTLLSSEITMSEKPNSKVPSTEESTGSVIYIATGLYEGTNLSDEKSYVLPKLNPSHKPVYHAAVSETCDTDGNVAYYSCTHCNKYYKDEECTIEITNVVISKHHTLTKVDAVSSNCDTDGNVEHYHCSKCSKNFSDIDGKNELTNILVSKQHSLIKVDAVASTCEKDGTIEYYHCGKCNKNFNNSEGQNELSSVVDPKHHKLTKVDAKEATTTENGNIEYYHCSVCNKNFKDANATIQVSTVTIPKINVSHNLVHHDATEATCDTDGNIEYYSCIDCEMCFIDEYGSIEITDYIIPKQHNLVKYNKKAATCEKDGNIEYYHCETCGKDFRDSTGVIEVNDVVLKSKGHQYDASGKCTICGSTKPSNNNSPSISGCFSIISISGITYLIGLTGLLYYKKKKYID